MTDGTDWIAHLRASAEEAAENWQEEADRNLLMRHAGQVIAVLPTDAYLALSTVFLALNAVITGMHVNYPGQNMGPRLCDMFRGLLDCYEQQLPPDGGDA